MGYKWKQPSKFKKKCYKNYSLEVGTREGHWPPPPPGPGGMEGPDLPGKGDPQPPIGPHAGLLLGDERKPPTRINKETRLIYECAWGKLTQSEIKANP